MMRRALLVGPLLCGFLFGLAHCVGDDPGTGADNGTDSGNGSDAQSNPDGATNNDSGSGDGGSGGDADAGVNCTSTPCVVQISAGGAHTCARIVDGTVRCWGANQYGESGGGTVIPADGGPGVDNGVNPGLFSTPNVVSGIPAAATVIGAGGSYRASGISCAATADMKMYCWGIDKSQQLGRGGDPRLGDIFPSGAHPTPGAVFQIQNVKDVSVGVRHACAVFTAGAVASWGGDLDAALGIAPVIVNGQGTTYGKPQTLAVAVKFERVVSRGQHNLALTDQGKVWHWGDNSDGQHGIAVTNWELPGEVTALSGTYKDIAGGRFHSCALDTTGKVWCFGKGNDGQLGRGPSSLVAADPAPKVVTFPAGSIVKQISGDEQHMIALLDNGSVYEWGRTIIGVPPDAVGAAVDTPVQVTLAGKALAVSCGYEHACALMDGGSVQCWGNNRSGELGRGNTSGAGTVSAPAAVVW